MELEIISQVSWHNDKYMTINNAKSKFQMRVNVAKWRGRKHVRLCHSLQRLEEQSVDMEVVDEFDTRPHMPVVFNAMLGRMLKIRTCKMPPGLT